MGITYGLTQLPLFEFLTRELSLYMGSDKTRPWQALLCGAIAAGLTQLLVQPVDTIRVRMVAQVGRDDTRNTYRCLSQALRKHVQSFDQLKCLWKGTRPALI